MADKLQELRERRARIANEMRELINKDGDFTADDNLKFENAKKEVDLIDANITAIQGVLDIDAAEASAVQGVVADHGVSEDEATAIRAHEKRMFCAWAAGGRSGLNAEWGRVQDERLVQVRNEMGTATGASGGYVVAPEYAPRLLETLKQYGGMRNVANVIQTASGAELSMPTTDATSEEGEIVGENQPVSDQDATFGTKSVVTYKYSSKVIAVPFELLQDSAIDLEAHLSQRLNERLGRGSNRHLTVGSGVGQPMGAVTAATIGKVGKTGSVSSVSWDDLVDLEHAVDPAYRASNTCRWMMHDHTLRELKKLKDGEGRPIWLPGLAVGAPDTILQYGYQINQHMPTMEANAKSILFGDWSRYMVRDVMQVVLFRFDDSYYARKGQVGFLAFMRCGGNLLDVGGALQAYQNSAS